MKKTYSIPCSSIVPVNGSQCLCSSGDSGAYVIGRGDNPYYVLIWKGEGGNQSGAR
jgi:hypothetical protein